MNLFPFQVGGALTNEHLAVYIERQADWDVLAHLRAMNYLLIIEPRQQGKTTLFNYITHQQVEDTHFVYVDVTTPDRSTKASWYQTLCPRILRQLRDFIPRSSWPDIPHNSAGWRDFLSEVGLLAQDAGRRVVVALDEIGAVTFPAPTDFFSVLRDIYNSRQAEPEFRHLTFWLMGAFEPRDLIQDHKVSPFNVARRVRLQDFTLGQVRQLVSQGGWSDEQSSALAERIHYWTDGQPYLTQ
ncbi:MAG: AAA-like domain-containing protein, partial [Ardenticatenaceae bacterium]